MERSGAATAALHLVADVSSRSAKIEFNGRAVSKPQKFQIRWPDTEPRDVMQCSSRVIRVGNAPEESGSPPVRRQPPLGEQSKRRFASVSQGLL